MKTFMKIWAIVTFLCIIPACMIGEPVLAIMCGINSILLLVSNFNK